MIHVEGLSKRYGARVLWENVNWHVRKNDRIESSLSGLYRAASVLAWLRALAGFESDFRGLNWLKKPLQARADHLVAESYALSH